MSYIYFQTSNFMQLLEKFRMKNLYMMFNQYKLTKYTHWNVIDKTRGFTYCLLICVPIHGFE